MTKHLSHTMGGGGVIEDVQMYSLEYERKSIITMHVVSMYVYNVLLACIWTKWFK